MGRIYIGTSGWQYSNWRGLFYPQNLPISRWLSFYSSNFNTVEVNYSFYRQPKSSTFQKWQRETGPNFVFAVKGNRFITHIKRLYLCEEALKIFFENASVLANSGVILWQLPPSLKQDLNRLSTFLKLLPVNFRHAFEFRHQSWEEAGTFKLLRKYNQAAVFQDWKDWPQIRETTANFIYIRLHGNKVLYTSGYTDKKLKIWAKRIFDYLKEGKDVYTYFNNDAAGFAVSNALTLQKLVKML